MARVKNWRPTRTRAAAACLIPLAGFGLIGCGWDNLYRVNHYHNDANQKLAEDASDKFVTFTKGAGSLTTLLDQDIQARKDLETTVSNARLKVLDDELSKLSTDTSWLRLRLRFLEEVGMLRDVGVGDGPIGPANVPISADDPRLTNARMSAVLQQADPELTERIELREARVQQAINYLSLIAAAQQVLAKQAQIDVDKVNQTIKAATTQPTAGAQPSGKSQPTTVPTTDVQVVSTVQSIFSHFNSVAQQIRSNQQSRDKATAVQAKLLAAIRDSRDSGSEVALVAVLGTGLDDESFGLLDDYIASLDDTQSDSQFKTLADLTDAIVNTPAQKDPQTKQPTDEWTALVNAAKTVLDSQTRARVASYLDVLKQLSAFENQAQASQPNADNTQIMIANARSTPADKRAVTIRPSGVLSKQLGGSPAGYVLRVNQFLDGLETFRRSTESSAMPMSASKRFVMVRGSVGAVSLPDGDRSTEPSRSTDQPSLMGTVTRVRASFQSLTSSSRPTLHRQCDLVTAQRLSAPKAAKGLRSAFTGQGDGSLQTQLTDNGAVKAARAVASGQSCGQRDRTAGELLQAIALAGDPVVAAKFAPTVTTPKVLPPDTGKSTAAPVKPVAEQKTTSATQAAGQLVNTINQIASDEDNEQKLAQLRIEQFLSDVLTAETDLYGENARHATAMLAIAQLELKRWALLDQLNQDYGEVYKYNDGEGQEKLRRAVGVAREQWGTAGRWAQIARADAVYDQDIRQLQADITDRKQRADQAETDIQNSTKQYASTPVDQFGDLARKIESLKTVRAKLLDDSKRLSVNLAAAREARLALVPGPAKPSPPAADPARDTWPNPHQLRLARDHRDEAAAALVGARRTIADSEKSFTQTGEPKPSGTDGVNWEQLAKDSHDELDAATKVAAASTNVFTGLTNLLKSAGLTADKWTTIDSTAVFREATDPTSAARLELDDLRAADGLRRTVEDLLGFQDEVIQAAKAVDDLRRPKDGQAVPTEQDRQVAESRLADAVEARSRRLLQIADDAEASQAAYHDRVMSLEGSVDFGREAGDKGTDVQTVRPLSARLFRGAIEFFPTKKPTTSDLVSLAPVDNGNDQKPVKYVQPLIGMDDSVHGSLRALAWTARFARAVAPLATTQPTSPPPSPIPGANAVTEANTRLFKAVRTVGGHMLMISENQHLSEDNAIRLHTEIAEHDIQLDSLEYRVDEAGYRLTLGDLKAFHTSGINDADIKTIQTILETGWLARIGTR